MESTTSAPLAQASSAPPMPGGAPLTPQVSLSAVAHVPPPGIELALRLAALGYAVHPANMGPEHAIYDAGAIQALWTANPDAVAKIASPDCEGLLRAARKLPSDGNERASAIQLVCQYAGALQPVERDLVLKALKEYSGINLGTLRSAAALSSKPGEPDHLDLARLTHAAIGVHDLLYTESYFFRWGGGVWRKTKDKEIKREVQAVLHTQRFCRNIGES